MSHNTTTELQTEVASTRNESWRKSVEDCRKALDKLKGTDWSSYRESYILPIEVVEARAHEQGLIFALKSPETTTEEVLQAVELIAERVHLTEEVNKSQNNPMIDALDLLRLQIGDSLFAQTFTDEPASGTIHTTYIDGLTVDGKTYQANAVQKLAVALGVTRIEELLAGGDEYRDQVRELTLRPENLHWLCHYYLKNANILNTTSESRWRWLKDAAKQLNHGLSEQEISDYTFNASRVDNIETQAQLLQRLARYEPEELRGITKFSGIHAIANYSAEQLELVSGLAAGAPEVINELIDRDVILALTNSVGEYGTATNDMAQEVDQGSGRVVPMEIRTMRDIPRMLNRLAQLGIKPSTLVLAAHSGEGEFIVSDLRDPQLQRHESASVLGTATIESLMADDSERGLTRYSIDKDAMGIGELLPEVMQGSRAIDDPDEQKGRIKIIFQACYAAKRTVEDESGEGESVLSRLADALHKSGVKDVDLYGADIGLQMRPVVNGVAYSLYNKKTQRREKYPATLISVTPAGIEEKQVAAISLRKSA